MQLLLEHTQKGKVFSLWAKYELLGQEEKLVEQYNIRQVVLVEGNPREEWSRARKMAGALAIVVYVAGIFWAVSQGGNDIQALLGALPLATYLSSATKSAKPSGSVISSTGATLPAGASSRCSRKRVRFAKWPKSSQSF